MKKLFYTVVSFLLLAMLLCGCAKKNADPFETAQNMIGSEITELTEKIGQPNSTSFASSCLGDGEDGEYYYDGFTVYTYRDNNGGESIYDVMPNAETAP